MTTVTRTTVSLYIDRDNRQWIVRDADGNFWAVPSQDDGWAMRRPYAVADAEALEPIPGHYRYLIGLPL